MMCQRIGRDPISTIGFGVGVSLFGETTAEPTGEDDRFHRALPSATPPGRCAPGGRRGAWRRGRGRVNRSTRAQAARAVASSAHRPAAVRAANGPRAPDVAPSCTLRRYSWCVRARVPPAGGAVRIRKRANRAPVATASASRPPSSSCQSSSPFSVTRGAWVRPWALISKPAAAACSSWSASASRSRGTRLRSHDQSFHSPRYAPTQKMVAGKPALAEERQGALEHACEPVVDVIATARPGSRLRSRPASWKTVRTGSPEPPIRSRCSRNVAASIASGESCCSTAWYVRMSDSSWPPRPPPMTSTSERHDELAAESTYADCCRTISSAKFQAISNT